MCFIGMRELPGEGSRGGVMGAGSCTGLRQLVMPLCLVSLQVLRGNADESGRHGSYYTKLANIHTSVGSWAHAFNPDITEYNIHVNPGTYRLTLWCDVEFTQYATDANLPLVAVNSKELDYSRTEPATYELQLEESPYAFAADVRVGVGGPPDQVNKSMFMQTIYMLHFSRSADLDKLLGLDDLIVEDDMGSVVDLMPSFVADPTARHFDAFVRREVRQVRITPVCDAEAKAVVVGPYGSDHNASEWLDVKESLTHTIFSPACTYGSDRRGVVVDVQQLVNLDDVLSTLELRVLGDQGIVQRVVEPVGFVVAAKAPIIELVPVYREDRTALELIVPGDLTYSLPIGVPSPPLEVPHDGNTTLTLVVRSGKQSLLIPIMLQMYVVPVAPEATLHNSKAESAGVLVMVVVCGSLLAAAFAIITAAASGVGAMRGRAVGAALRSLVLLLQFMALSDVAKARSSWTDFVRPLLWLCLLPPKHRFASAGGALQRLSCVDAVEGLQNCVGVVVILAVGHFILLTRWRLVACCRYTLPHRLRFGSWEVVCIIYLLYPASNFAMLILMLGPTYHSGIVFFHFPLLSELPDVVWQSLAAIALVGPLVIAMLTYYFVWRAQRDRLVVWIPRDNNVESSATSKQDGARQGSGRLRGQDGGFFCDTMCDQLTTLMVERRFSDFLPALLWASTIGDLRTVKCDLGEQRNEKDTYLPVGADSESEEDASDASHLPVAFISSANTRVDVEVVSTVKLAYGHRELCCSEVGHVSHVPWLEAHVSAEALLRLKQEVNPLLHDAPIPLSVRAEQLQGPLTSGWLRFCFEGLRWPSLPALELVVRVALGVATALASSADPMESTLRPIAFVAAGAFGGVFFVLVLHEAPCSDLTENILLLLANLGIAMTAFACMACSAQVFGVEFYSLSLFVVVACTATPLILYALLVAVGFVTTLACPMGTDGQRSSLSSCNIDLVLRGPESAWWLMVPAECKVPVSTAIVHTLPDGRGGAKVQATDDLVTGMRPRLEFPVLDYLSLEHKLEPPLLVLFGSARDLELSPGLYRSECVYPDENPWAMVLQFVQRGHTATSEYAPEIAQEVMELYRRRGGTGHILAVVIVPIPRFPAPWRPQFLDDDAEGEETEALLSTTRSSVSDR